MKYKDYYQVLEVAKEATDADIKKAYRKLAHRYHPDTTKDPNGEEKFKEVAEAYATLKSPEKRTEYDNLGRHQAGDNFTPPPEWQAHYGGDASSFDDVDFSDFINAFRSGDSSRSGHTGGTGRSGGRQRAKAPVRGQDYSVAVEVQMEVMYHGGTIDVSMELPETDQHGLPHRKLHTFRITIPKGARDGQRMRLTGQGAAGRNGGQAGDLYAVLAIAAHARFRVSGSDLFFDLPLAAHEAALGVSIQVPILGGMIELNVKPGTSSGQRLRISKRGLPKGDGQFGDLYAVTQIQIPKNISKAEHDLYQQLADVTTFQPRAHFNRTTK